MTPIITVATPYSPTALPPYTHRDAPEARAGAARVADVNDVDAVLGTCTVDHERGEAGPAEEAATRRRRNGRGDRRMGRACRRVGPDACGIDVRVRKPSKAFRAKLVPFGGDELAHEWIERLR